MGLSNDERGWVMTCLSGIACVFGASIICIDIIVRQFPGKKNWRIQDSDTFLSASLSLSFGVMLFSALYSMLPSSKDSLINGGFSPKQASWILIACFLGGVLGIQVLSRIMHQFMPSHTVDCDHSHDDKAQEADEDGDVHAHKHDHGHTSPSRPQTPQMPRRSSLPGHMMSPSGNRKRSFRQGSYFNKQRSDSTFAPTAESEINNNQLTASQPQPPAITRRPSLPARVTNTITQLAAGKKLSCDNDGPCYGYTDPCGQECFKNIHARGGYRAPTRMASGMPKPALTKSATATSHVPTTENTPLLQGIAEEDRPHSDGLAKAPTRYYTAGSDFGQESDVEDSETETSANGQSTLRKTQTNGSTSSETPDRHHHHVPANAFLSIGLQTSIAIALHKLPEGFITYATNHANPELGFAVFLALFIHNITEGFAMALPLYLAINNRLKAMAISFVLGGLSQPIGAAVAAVWFKLAGHGDWAPSEGVYGGMFAVTAGIMASVALQLFSESLDLTHSRMLCMVGAFAGMAILGISSALTA
ncbi:Zinc transporter [Vermiconidia calcicola]|uniref:Zinc transporter n=1 Tax=Vermiconidia calcicola TaxID=1690605 RepID=A0ACC3N9S0_9PEZI|nr:Zinc transporter [Vermiconidia calcicola]